MSESLPDPLQSLLKRKLGPATGAPGGRSAADQGPRPQILHVAGTGPRERGLARAAASAARIRAAQRGYAQLFTTLGIDERAQRTAAKASLAALEAWDPAQAAELAGVATGSGLQIADLMTTVARTEILTLAPAAPQQDAVDGTESAGGTEFAGPAAAGAEIGQECSTLGLQRPGSSLVGQTWDWHAQFQDCWHFHYVEGLPDPAEDPARDAAAGTVAAAAEDPAAGQNPSPLNHAGFAEFGMLGKIGMNSAGLAVDLNILSHEADGPGGVPIHAVLARILGSARTIEQALDIIASAPVSASSLITITSADRVLMVELTPGGHRILEPGRTDQRGVHESGRDQAIWFCHTNDFQDSGLAAGQKRGGVSNSPQRFRVLNDRVTGASPASPAFPESADGLLNWLATDPGADLVARRPKPDAPLGLNIATLVTVRMDPARKLVRMNAGLPQDAALGTVEFAL
jgi:isopenicillin-N N-acyltransferase-like protein